MSVTPRTGRDQREGTSGTLGELLYSAKAKARVTEKDLLAMLQCIVAGDRLALRALYERTHRIVFTLAARVIDNEESAEEVTLDVFQDVWRQAAAYDAANGSVIGWILSLARARAIDQLRLEQRKSRGGFSRASLTRRATFPTTAAAHWALERKAEAHVLQHALTVLTPEEREAIESALFSELAYAQVAARLHQPPGSVKTRISYALAKLRTALSAQGEER